jgi:hypothetical protein
MKSTNSLCYLLFFRCCTLSLGDDVNKEDNPKLTGTIALDNNPSSLLCAYDRMTGVNVSFVIDSVSMANESNIWIGLHGGSDGSSSMYKWEGNKLGVTYSMEEQAVRESVKYSSGKPVL